MDPCSEAPRLGSIEILEIICGDNFASGIANAKFQTCVVDIKLALHQHLSLYPQCFVLFTIGKPVDKKDDVNYEYQPSLST